MIELNEKNLVLYAAQNYTNKRILDLEEFYEDFSRFKYLKRLFTRYTEKRTLQERLILNHLIKIYNVFRPAAATHICQFKIDESAWPALKTFLLYLNYIEDHQFINTSTDLYVAKQLQQI